MTLRLIMTVFRLTFLQYLWYIQPLKYQYSNAHAIEVIWLPPSQIFKAAIMKTISEGLMRGMKAITDRKRERIMFISVNLRIQNTNIPSPRCSSAMKTVAETRLVMSLTKCSFDEPNNSLRRDLLLSTSQITTMNIAKNVDMEKLVSRAKLTTVKMTFLRELNRSPVSFKLMLQIRLGLIYFTYCLNVQISSSQSKQSQPGLEDMYQDNLSQSNLSNQYRDSTMHRFKSLACMPRCCLISSIRKEQQCYYENWVRTHSYKTFQWKSQ